MGCDGLGVAGGEGGGVHQADQAVMLQSIADEVCNGDAPAGEQGNGGWMRARGDESRGLNISNSGWKILRPVFWLMHKKHEPIHHGLLYATSSSAHKHDSSAGHDALTENINQY